MPRIEPIAPPYDEDVAERLAAMMPAGVPPILLFRTLVRNMPMSEAMGAWGGYELSRRLSLTRRDREIVIDRTCARCGCEYEWGVHVAFFAERVGLTGEHIASLTHGQATDACWDTRRDALLIEVVDALHDRAQVDEALWRQLGAVFADDELLDILMLAGWYHAISFVANGVRLELEDGAPRFEEVG